MDLSESSTPVLTPGAKESLVGTIMELLLYGIFLPIACTCSIILYRKHKARHANYYLIATFGVICLLSTIRLIVDVTRTVHAWSNINPQLVVDYGAVNGAMSMIKNVVWIIETIAADSFICYRVYVVWSKSWVMVVLPSLLILGNVASGIWYLTLLGTFDESAPLFSTLNTSGHLWSGLTLATNLICSGFIWFRIWTIRRGISGHNVNRGGSDPVQRLVTMIVESAAVYTLLLLAALITTSIGSYASYVFFDMTSPTIAIVFSSIILRASAGQAFGDTSGLTSTGNNFSSGNPNGGGRIHGHTKSGVQIQLSRIVQTKIDPKQGDTASQPHDYGSTPVEDKYRTEDV